MSRENFTRWMMGLLGSCVLSLLLIGGLLWMLIPRPAVQAQAVNPGFTVDLMHHRIWGRVSAGDIVTVTRQGGDYGAAQADGTGFFWTPLWDAATAGPATIQAGDVFSFYINGSFDSSITVLDVIGQVDVLSDRVVGHIPGASAGTPITVTLQQWASSESEPHSGTPQVSTTTDASGNFTATLGGIDLAPHQWVAVDYPSGGGLVRDHLVPQHTFIVHSTWNSGDGFAQPGQVVTTTIYTGTGTVGWVLTTTANQNGLYTLRPDGVPVDAVSIDPGDVVVVDLGGGAVISTVVAPLVARVDTATDVVYGIALPGATVRVSLWQWDDQGEYRYYQVITTTAVSGLFTANLSSLVDVSGWDTIQAAVADAGGDETVISFGAPFIQVGLDGGWITTRVDQGGVPITATLNTGSQVYTWLGRSYYPSGYAWGIQFDSGNGPVDIEPGHIITVESPTWQGVMTVAQIDLNFDLTNNRISGQMPSGLADVRVSQWGDDRYPLNGWAMRRIGVSSPFTVTWSDFDLRWSSWVEVNHVSNGQFVTCLRRDLPYIEANVTDNGVGGVAWVPGERITGTLYQSDGVTIKAVTSQDFQDDPLYFWLGDWQGQRFNAGDWITVTGESGWQAGVQIVELNVYADETTDWIWGDAPPGLLGLHWDNRWNDGLDWFAPTDSGGNYQLDWSLWGRDVQWGHSQRAHYLSLSGNQVLQQLNWPQIVANYGPSTNNNHVRGNGAEPNAAVHITVTQPGVGVLGTVEVTADEWGNLDSQDALPAGCLAPNHVVEVDFGNGVIDSMTVLTISAEAHIETDVLTVTAPVGTNICEINFNHEGGGGGGLHSEIGASGYITFDLMAERGFDIRPFTQFNIHACQPPHGHNTQYSFSTGGLRITADYTDNWVGLDTDPNATLTITVAGKATMIAQADGGGHFESHWRNDLWNPEPPEIEPGDVVTVTTAARMAEINPVGLIDGTSDVNTDRVVGMLHAPWFSPTPLLVRCEIHEPGGPAIDVLNVDPDGGAFECDFGSIGWDITPGQNVAVHYVEPDGDRVQTHLRPPVLRLNINYGHDWVEGNYAAGHTVWITVTQSDGFTIKGTAVLTTGQVPWWGGQTGFSTNWQGWQGERPDIAAGDWVYGLTDEGLTSIVHLGTINGFLDADADLITGTIDAPWIGQEVQVECHPWGAPGGTPGKQDWVLPNGSDVFTCSWAGEWDILGNQDVAVFYHEPDEDQVGDVFRRSAPHLRIRKTLYGNAGAGGVAVFQIQYENNGYAPAAFTVITDTMWAGLTYITDTSGLPHSGDGTPGNPLVWDAGTLPSGRNLWFDVYAAITADEGEWITNTVQIATADPYDEVRPWEYGDGWGKSSTWSGQVQANDTHLNIDKGAWTNDPAPGTDFVYWVNACNQGSTASSELTLTDTLPVSLTLVSWWGQHTVWSEVSAADHELAVRHPALPGGWCSQIYVRVHLTDTVSPDDTICNTAILTASNDLESDNNEVTDCRTVGVPYTNLYINKEFAQGQLVPGGQIRYNIGSGNNGNMPVTTTIRITDTQPAYTTFAGAWWFDESGAHPYTPTQVGVGFVVWTLPGLDNGYNHSFQVAWDIDPSIVPGTLLTNTAAISIDPAEYNSDDNVSVWVEQVYPHGPNLRVRKWGNWDNWGPGTRHASYNVTVENVGDQPVNTVILTDTYPADMRLDGGLGLGFWRWWDWRDHPDEHYFTVTLELLEPGWSVGLNFALITDTEPLPWGLVFTNTAQVMPLPNDTNPADNTDWAVLFTGPDLSVQKTLLVGDLLPNEIVAFTLHFANGIEGWQWWWGTQGHTLITDTLPAGMTYITSTLHDCDGPTCPYIAPTVNGQQLVFELGPLNAGGWNEIYVVARIAGTVTGLDTLVNQVKIGSSQPEIDREPFYDNNLAQLAMPIALPYLQVGKVWQSSRVAGTPLTYTLTVTNSGHVAATNVQLGDTWQGHTYTWTLPSIGPYTGTATAELVTVVPCSGQAANNQYRVIGSDQGVSSGPGAAVTFDVVPPALLADFNQSAAALLVGQTLRVTDTSTTNGVPIAARLWRFGDGSTASTPVAAHTYAAAGSYVVTLIITDACGYHDTVTATVQVSLDCIPLSGVSITRSPAVPVIYGAVAFTATVSPPNADLPISFVWNFGDGHAQTSGTAQVTHTYTRTGVMTMTVTATNLCTPVGVSRTIQLDIAPIRVYLPVVLRQYP